MVRRRPAEVLDAHLCVCVSVCYCAVWDERRTVEGWGRWAVPRGRRFVSSVEPLHVTHVKKSRSVWVMLWMWCSRTALKGIQSGPTFVFQVHSYHSDHSWHTHTHSHTHSLTHTHTRTHSHTHRRTCTHTHTHTHTHIVSHTHSLLHTQSHTHTHRCTHTQARAHTRDGHFKQK